MNLNFYSIFKMPNKEMYKMLACNYNQNLKCYGKTLRL